MAYSNRSEEKQDKHPWRSLAEAEAAGVLLFVGMLYVVLTMAAMARAGFDSSVVYFYPWMAGLGAVVGFERWWGLEYGPSNPWYDN